VTAGMEGLQRGAWLPVQGRGLVFIGEDMAAAQAAATALVVAAAVAAERVRLLAVLHQSVICTELGDAVTTRCVDQAFAVTG
jgi:hypothetical protein